METGGPRSTPSSRGKASPARARGEGIRMMPSLTPRRRRWLILALIFSAIVLNYFDRQIVSILKPTLKSEFQLDDAGYAVLANIFTCCYAVMYPVAGLLVDRF